MRLGRQVLALTGSPSTILVKKNPVLEKLRYCFLDLNCVKHRRFHLDKGSAIESEGGRFLGAQHEEYYSGAGGAGEVQKCDLVLANSFPL